MKDPNDDLTRVDVDHRYRRLGRLVGDRGEEEIGLIVDDRYRIEERIGRGGMGEVFCARDLKLNRQVAVKVVTARGQGSDGWRALADRFQGEIEALSQLEHPGIVPIHDCGRFPDDRYYLTMQYVSGDTFSRLIAQGAALRTLLGYVIEMCEIVHVAHEKKIVHRDLKPDNVMIREDGRVVVLDWGVAKVLGRAIPVTPDSEFDGTERTQVGDVIGTLAYMAPEQAVGDHGRVGVRSDVYSVGAILYQILTGVSPYRSASIEGLLQMVQRGELVPPSVRTEDRRVDSELEALVLRAMAFDPLDRYASALELRADLLAYLEGRPLRAVAYSPWQLGRKWARRNRALCGVALGLCFLGLLLWGGSRWKDSRERNQRFVTYLEKARSQYALLPSLVDLLPREQEENRLRVRSESPEVVFRRQESIRHLLRVIATLDQAYALRPGDPRVRGIRIRMGLELGQLALAAGNDLLAERSFSELSFYGMAPSDISRWLDRVDRARTATLRSRKIRLTEMLKSLREVEGNLHGGVEDLVFEAARFQDVQTVEVLEAEMNLLIDRIRSEGSQALWSQSERDRAVFCCRVLGRIGMVESVPVLARWLEAVEDEDLLFEAARALCYTRLQEAYQPLLSFIFGMAVESGDSKSRVFTKLQPWLGLVPESEENSSRSPSQRAFERGVWALVRGKFSVAIRYLSELSERESEEAKTYLWRGIAYMKSGRLEEAKADFKTCQRLGPPRASVSNWLGVLSNQKGKFREALAHFEEALRIDPGLATAHLNSFISYSRVGDLNRAQEAIDRALEVRSDFAEAWFNRAAFRLEQGRIEQALFDLGRALLYRPEMELAHLLRAQIFLQRHELEEARRSCEGVLRKRKGDINHTRALVLRAQIWLASWQKEPADEKTAKARTLLDQAIRQHPQFSDCYLFRGHIHRIEGRSKEATEDYERCLRLNPNLPGRLDLQRYIREHRAK
ncbi:MAG: protein kinase [Planctomycetota bacterium]|jgi:serine/threonine protein kinase/tetratricopeptide (TPR) repeat protein|nr:protein kinase [Planctomycetota bacterium]